MSGVEIPKGDPGALRHAGRQWAALADLLAEQATRVDGQGSLISTASIADTSGGTWWGAASNAYRSYCSTLATCLATGGDAFQTAAGAVRTFAHDLRHEQNNAKRAREAAMEALSDLRAAQQAHDEAGARLTAANGAVSVADGRAGAAALGGPLSHPQLEQAGHDRSQAVAAASAAARDLRVAQARIETAERKLERARNHGKDANEAAERAARICTARLHDAMGGMRSPELLGAAPIPITTGGGPPTLPGSGDPFKLPFHAPTPAEELERLREELAQEAEHRGERTEGGAVDRFAGEFEGFFGVRPPLGIGDPGTRGYKDGKKLGNVASYFPTPASLLKQGGKRVLKRGVTPTKKETGDEARSAAKKAAPIPLGPFLKDNWHRATFPNEYKSVKYHWREHAGPHRTMRAYTEDAIEVFDKHKSAGVPITLKDGTPGLRIKTGKGQPGGIFTPDGEIVTFWYK